MRNIKGQCLEKMASPIKFIMYHIHEALVNIAPEMKKRFDKEYSEFILEYIDSPDWIINVNTQKKHIKLSRRVVEIFWAVSYSYVTFYTKVVQGEKVDKKKTVNLIDDNTVRKSMQLLKWIYESWLNKDDGQWPGNLPKPVENPNKGSMENVADELCLCAISVLLHHELAHIRLGHSGNSTIDQEKEADIFAIDWILDHNLEEWDYRFVKRAIGIALAFEVMTAYSIYTNNYGGVTHPYSYDRLFHNIDRFIDDPQHIVWAFIVSTLKLHFDNAKISVADVVHNNFRDCAESYIDRLSMMS